MCVFCPVFCIPFSFSSARLEETSRMRICRSLSQLMVHTTNYFVILCFSFVCFYLKNAQKIRVATCTLHLLSGLCYKIMSYKWV